MNKWSFGLLSFSFWSKLDEELKSTFGSLFFNLTSSSPAHKNCPNYNQQERRQVPLHNPPPPTHTRFKLTMTNISSRSTSWGTSSMAIISAHLLIEWCPTVRSLPLSIKMSLRPTAVVWIYPQVGDRIA